MITFEKMKSRENTEMPLLPNQAFIPTSMAI